MQYFNKSVDKSQDRIASIAMDIAASKISTTAHASKGQQLNRKDTESIWRTNEIWKHHQPIYLMLNASGTGYLRKTPLWLNRSQYLLESNHGRDLPCERIKNLVPHTFQ